MNDAKTPWTPGPWTVIENASGGARVDASAPHQGLHDEPCGTCGAPAGVPCPVQSRHVGVADVLSRAGVEHPVQQTCLANATLIAAAPDLAEALAKLLEATEESEGIPAATVPCEAGCSMCTAQIAARAALRKAGVT